MEAALWGLLAATIAVGIEGSYRYWPHLAWLQFVPWILVPSIIMSYAIFQIVRGADGLIGAFIIFSSTTLTLRVLMSFVVGDAIRPPVWGAFALMVAARLVQAVL